MKGVRVEHIGVIVKDLEANLRLLGNGFGFRMGPIKEMPDAGLKTARLEAENVTVELLQYTSEGPCFGREVMGGAEGYNHMALEVPDIEAAISGLKENGYKVLAGFPRQGSHGRVAFLDPATTEGILLELCEAREADSRTDH